MYQCVSHSVGSSLERLAFGGSNLLGDKTAAQGRALLETAFEYGIRHFDTAPAYGYGDAEVLLGEFARGKRDRLFLTTKFGLQPLGGTGSKGVVRFARRIMRSSPWFRKLVKQKARTLIQSGQFNPISSKKSLEKSLRKLGTEYVDLLLLHECTLSDCREELLRFLEDAKTQGKIRSFGIGTRFEEVESLLLGAPAFCEFVQFKNTVLEDNLSKVTAHHSAYSNLITHGCLTVLPLLQGRLQSDQTLCREWERVLQIDVTDPTIIANLALQHALYVNPQGRVIFQSSSQARIRKNLTGVTENVFRNTTLKVFGELAAPLADLAPPNVYLS